MPLMRATLMLALFVTTISVACSTDENHDNDDNPLTRNNWQLISTLSDTANGSQWQQYTGTPLFLHFGTDGTVVASSGLFPSNPNRYSITNNDTLVLINSSIGISTEFSYELSGYELVLRGPCSEACGLRFGGVFSL
jgi:hypothetical protein